MLQITVVCWNGTYYAMRNVMQQGDHLDYLNYYTARVAKPPVTNVLEITVS